ncbi:MAG: glycosyltransferase, partial [Synechococcales cyanobacterium]
FPSLYEPFGIVVLESFAAKVPVVVSDAGGLPEIVRHGETGIVTSRNNPHSLSAGILEILQKPSLGEQLVESAYLDLCTRFNWSGLAQQTELIYKDISAE